MCACVFVYVCLCMCECVNIRVSVCMYVCMYVCVNCLILRFRIYLWHISEYDSSSVGRYCIALVPISRLLFLLFLPSMCVRVRIIFFLLFVNLFIYFCFSDSVYSFLLSFLSPHLHLFHFFPFLQVSRSGSYSEDPGAPPCLLRTRYVLVF